MKFQNLSVKRLFGRVAMELVLSTYQAHRKNPNCLIISG